MLVVIGALLIATDALQHWQVNEYAITPGNATPVAPLVKISGLATNAHRDVIMLTDVYLQQLTAWQYVVMHFQHHVEFLSGSQLVDPGVSSAELDAQGYLQMSDSKQNAEVAAFSALGWKLRATPSGAVVNAVVNDSPASRAKLHVADEIVSLDAKPVTSACALEGAMHPIAPGVRVNLGVRRAHISAAGVITWASPTTVTMRTAASPGSVGSSGCPGVVGVNRSWIGVALENGVHYALPGKVSINTKDIGGPSAGLAMTLTLIDRLSGGSLTGGHKVAATGTIDQYGNVGDVGGVAEKTVAVQDAGAQYFIVPQVEVATAKANATPGLHILGVNTLAQALRDLRALGGARPIALTRPS